MQRCKGEFHLLHCYTRCAGRGSEVQLEGHWEGKRLLLWESAWHWGLLSKGWKREPHVKHNPKYSLRLWGESCGPSHFWTPPPFLLLLWLMARVEPPLPFCFKITGVMWPRSPLADRTFFFPNCHQRIMYALPLVADFQDIQVPSSKSEPRP